MVNIDHVNISNYLIRILFFPPFFFIWLFRYLGCRGESKRYLGGISQLSPKERYEKFFRFYKSYLFFCRKSYTFLYEEKILQIQAVFVVDEIVDWESIVLIRYLFEKHGQKLPTPLLYSSLIKGKPSLLWNLLDVRFGEGDIEGAIESGRSFFIEKDLLSKSLECSSLIKRSHLPIVPIHAYRTKKKNFYRFGSVMRATDLMRIRDEAFSGALENVFGKIKIRFLEDIRKSSRKKG